MLVRFILPAITVFLLSGCFGNSAGDLAGSVDQSAVDSALAGITIEDFVFAPGDSAGSVSTDFAVPTESGVEGVELSWTTKDGVRTSVSGGTIAVTRVYVGGSVEISVVVTATKGSASGTKDFSITVLPADVIDEEPILRASDTTTFDDFGFAVAMDGRFAVVGAPQAGTDSAGAVYVFERNSSGWDEAHILTASDGADGDGFGFSVAIDGSTIVVGAGDDGGTGGAMDAYVFELQSGSWEETALLSGSEEGLGDRFGYSVAVSGSTIIVGAPGDDGPSDALDRSGAAYVFERVNGGWDEVALLRASNEANFFSFGLSVAVDGNAAIVGAPDDDNSIHAGSAYIFEDDGTGWEETAVLTASNGEANDDYGIAVAISGERALVGAYQEDGQTNSTSASGAVYSIEWNGSSWAEVDLLRPSDVASGARFGHAIAMDGQFAAIGAYGANSFTGSAYLFAHDGTSWAEDKIFTPSNGEDSDVMGWHVGIGPYAMIAGAPEEGGDANGLTSSGAAYVFE